MPPMENKYILELKRVALDFFKDDQVRIILFGSRAREDNYPSSDVDIGLIPYGKFEEKKITLFREKLEDLNIPYRVDVWNFSEVPQKLRKEGLREAVVWKD